MEARSIKVTVFFVLAALTALGIGLVGTNAFASTDRTEAQVVPSGPEAEKAGSPAPASPACGPNWAIVASANVGTRENYFKGIAVVSATDAWAVGYNRDNSNIPQTLVQRWNGSAWSMVPSPGLAGAANYLNGEAVVSASDVWAVGYSYNGSVVTTLIERWNGNAWSVVLSPNQGTHESVLNGVAAVSANDVWAVGDYINNANISQTLIEHWDGGTWSIVPSPNSGAGGNDLKAVAALSNGNVWAVGSWGNPSAPSQTLVERWNGSSWSTVVSPNVGPYQNQLTGIAAVSASDLWAVGYYASTTNTEQTLIERWDGNSWSVASSQNVGAYHNYLYGVAATSATNVWAVGSYYDINAGAARTLIERWNGNAWSVVLSPNQGAHENILFGVAATSASDVWAVGRYENDSSVWQSLVEHYNPCSVTATPSRTRTSTPTRTPTVGGPTSTPDACSYSYATGSSNIVAGTTDTGNHCDDCTTLVNLPFPFHLYDQAFNSVYVSSNGNAQFATDTNDYQVRCLPSTTMSSYVILPYWTDLRTDGTGHGIFTAVLGTAPARVFVIEWRAGLVNSSGSADFALYLYENSAVKRFNVIYGQVPQGYTNYTVGVQKNGTTFTEYACNGAGGSITNGLLISFTESCGTPMATPTSPSQVSPTPTQCSVQFSDVPPGSTFYSYVRCMVCRGIISGYQDGTFHPNANVTRGQLAKIVSNAAGFTDTQSTQLFQDVPMGSTFFSYVGRLASRDIMSGYACGGTGEPCLPPANLPYFRPNNNATRGQISKIVSNAAGFNDPPGDQRFQDVPSSSTFYDYIQRLASRSVMGGYACGGVGEPCVPPANLPYFRPNNNATRGQTTKIVSNALLPDCSAMLP